MKPFTPKIGILIIVLFLIVSAGVLIMNRNLNVPVDNTNSTLAANAEKSGDIGEYYDGTKNATAPATPIPKPGAIKTYIYPGSATEKSTTSSLTLLSTDSPEAITNWYKEKIKELEFNAKSFSQTNTEGAIFNKLTAVKPGEKIEITIKKDQSTSKTTITVDRS